MKKIVLVFFLLSLLPGSSFISGQIDSQWRGPERNGIYPAENLLKEWPEKGPQLVWSVEGLGEGFSSPAVTSDRIYLTGMDKSEGFLFAYNKKGDLIWKTSYGPEWNGSHSGARSSPTVVGDKIYLESAKGQVVCFDSQGKRIWSVDLIKTFGAKNLEWGMTESLLVDGDRVFCTPGGPKVTVAALNRHSGETLWTVRSKGETSGYCSPCLVKHGAVNLLLTMTANAVIGVDADKGEFLWRYSHTTEYDVNANTPLYKDGYIYSVSGYGTGGQKFELSENGRTIKRLWWQRNQDTQMGASVLLDGFIYGCGHNNRGWQCIDWQTGKSKYKAREIGHRGAIIFADGMLYCYSEGGHMALVKPNPNDFDVISSFRIRKGSGEHWAHPVIKDGRLYVRHGDTLLVYNILDSKKAPN